MDERRALVVYESMFGNTELVAAEMAAGLSEYLDVDLRNTVDCPAAKAGTYDVIVVGGPTHAFTMSTTHSRRDAWLRGARVGVMGTGMREWLEQLAAPPAGISAAFDTRVRSARLLPGSASRAATRVLRRLGSSSVAAPKSFYVEGERGPLVRGELARARAWGRTLALLADQNVPTDRTHTDA